MLSQLCFYFSGSFQCQPYFDKLLREYLSLASKKMTQKKKAQG